MADSFIAVAIKARADERSLQLDCVRGLAIFLAMGWHISTITGFLPLDLITWPARQVGWIGVDLFFVLSGFLVGRLIFREIDLTAHFDYPRFLVRRVFRLWPVLYFYLAVQFAFSGRPWATYLWQNLLHVQNYFETPLRQLWSLAVEEHFYLGAGLLLPWLARNRLDRRTYPAIMIAILIACPALRLWGVWCADSEVALQWRTHYRIDSLAAGVLLAMINLYWPQRFAAMARPKLLLALVALACAAFAAPTHGSAVGDVLGYSAAYIGSGALILAAYQWQWPRLLTPFVRWMAFLGLYSYSIYIWHHALATASEHLAAARLGLSNLALLECVRFAAAIGGSYVVAKVIERPMIGLRDRLFPGLAREPVAIGAVAEPKHA